MSTALLPHQQRNLEHWLSCRQWPLRVACDLLTGSIPAPETWGEEASSQAADRALEVVLSAIRVEEIRDEDLEFSNEFRDRERVYYISPKVIWTWAQGEPWCRPHPKLLEHLAGLRPSGKECNPEQTAPRRAQLKDDEKAILMALYNARKPLTYASLAARALLSPTPCRSAREELERMEMVVHIGKRGGYSLTETGKIEARRLTNEANPRQTSH